MSVGITGVGNSGANPQLTGEQQANANTIISVCMSEGVGTQGAILAIMCALQESDLKNLSGGDRDSVGLFQQRPSMGWGTIQQCMDPVYATKSFLNGHGTNPGLKNISGWQNMPEWEAIQAVQRSGYPQAYQKHKALATEIVNYSGNVPAGGTIGTPISSATNFLTMSGGQLLSIVIGMVLVLIAVARITHVDKQLIEAVKIAAVIK